MDDFSIPERRVYQLSYLLPILVPLVLWGLDAVIDHTIDDDILMFLGVGILIIGIPYILCVIGILIFMRKKSIKAWRIMIAVCPFIFAFISYFCLLIFFIIDDMSSEYTVSYTSHIQLSGVFSLMTVLFGYGYVVITFALSAFLIYAGLVRKGE